LKASQPRARLRTNRAYHARRSSYREISFVQETIMARGILAPLGFGSQGADPFTLLRQEMEQLFDNVSRAPAQGGAPGAVMSPRMDVSEDEKEIRISAELPGVTPDKVDVTINDDLLTIRGEREMEQRTERKNYHLLERAYSTFQRTLRLPYSVDAAKVQARFDDGVLTVTIPKTDAKQGSQRIQVSRGEERSQGAGESTGESKPH
jgi:HSP20 family protein